MDGEIKPLLERLDLERLDRDLFRGTSPQDGRSRVFGGQVAAQALVAAARTVDARLPHSLHAFFLRPGDPKTPIIYEVDRIRNGRSFSTRRVVAIQNGEAIFNMAVSFQKDEPGADFQVEMPEAPEPETIPTNEVRLRKAAEQSGHPLFRFMEKWERPIEIRDVDPLNPLKPKKKPGQHLVWIKARNPLPHDPVIHYCVLTYASDLTLFGASLREHGLTWHNGKFQGASLDHAIWFHRPFRADDYLLYVTESASTSHSRGLNHGKVFDRSGALVASVAQEGLMRMRE